MENSKTQQLGSNRLKNNRKYLNQTNLPITSNIQVLHFQFLTLVLKITLRNLLGPLLVEMANAFCNPWLGNVEPLRYSMVLRVTLATSYLEQSRKLPHFMIRSSTAWVPGTWRVTWRKHLGMHQTSTYKRIDSDLYVLQSHGLYSLI